MGNRIVLKSMTAFARQESHGDWGELVWELRTVNHRYLDVSLRLPEELRGLEAEVRKRASGVIRRGKLDCTLHYRTRHGTATGLEVNRDLVRALVAASDEVGVLMGASATPTPLDVLAWPGVVCAPTVDKSELSRHALETLEMALASLLETRQREGVRLQALLQERLDAIGPLVGRVRRRMPGILAAQRQRMHDRLGELRDSLDPSRLEQEMVMLTQRLDVEEELDRLLGHVEEMGQVLARDEAVGRRLDFLMQEFNREANTLGSKSQDAEVTRVAVELKVLIEQMREQIQNVE